MTRHLSPIHRPFEDDSAAVESPVLTRMSKLAALDQRLFSGRPHSLGAGGASAAFSRGVDRALVEEIAEQLREGPFEAQEGDSEIRKWALEIIEAFEEK